MISDMKKDLDGRGQYSQFLKEYAGKRRLMPLYIFIIAFIIVNTCNFSEGQMRRLDIMRNVFKEPDVLIFDEATANIDRKRRGDFYTLLRTLSEHKIIIYSTHNEEELAEADEVINLAELC